MAEMTVAPDPAEFQCLRTAPEMGQECWHHQRRKAGQLCKVDHPEKPLQKLLGLMPVAAALLGLML